METVQKKDATFYEGFLACVPTVMGYLGIGLALGIVGKGIGLSVWQVLLMSVFVYAGSAQFAICGLLVLQAPVFSIVFTVFFINLRHFLMSLSVAHLFKADSLLTNIGIGSLLTDESYGVLVTEMHAGKKISSQWLECHGLLSLDRSDDTRCTTRQLYSRSKSFWLRLCVDRDVFRFILVPSQVAIAETSPANYFALG